METSTRPRRLRLKEELLLALLPTATVLLTLALVEKIGGQHLFCAALASSAFLIYLDPEHETNAVRTLVLSQAAAAGVGTAAWWILGSGYASAGIAMSAAILLMIFFNAVHPPAVTTSLAFSLRPDNNSSLALFGLAVAITAALVLLQRAVVRLVACRQATGGLVNPAAAPGICPSPNTLKGTQAGGKTAGSTPGRSAGLGPD